MRFRIPALLLAALLSSSAVQAGDPALETTEQKVVYAIGISIADSLSGLELSDEELQTVFAAIQDRRGGDIRIDPKEVGPEIRGFVVARKQLGLERAHKISSDWLAKVEQEDGVEKMANGILVRTVKTGEGDPPLSTDRVLVHYKGTLHDGTVFDETAPDSPSTLPLNGVIKCWTQTVTAMLPGGKAEIWCPAAMAYGDTGSQGNVPPGHAIKFEIEFLKVAE